MYGSEENTGNDRVGCYGIMYAFNLNTYTDHRIRKMADQ